MDKQGFSDYLRDVGFNDNGINEILKRFEEGREDREDVYQLKRYKEYLAELETVHKESEKE